MTPYKELKELFSNILRPAQEILDEIGPERKVYPLENILKAFEISKIHRYIELYDKYEGEIPDAHEENIKLQAVLDRLLEEIEVDDDFETNSYDWDAMEYLDVTCLKVKMFIESSGPEALCYPWKDRDLIEACFDKYHTYMFLEKHVKEIGMDEFLLWLPYLEHSIVKSRINGTFYWDKFDTAPLHEKAKRQADEEARQDELKLERKVGRRS